jgi:hypothetical protein
LTGELGARTSEEGFAWGTVAVAGVLTLGLIGYGVAHHHSPSSRDGDAANAAVAADVAANTYAVGGASVYVTATGAVVVTTGATTTGYAVGSAGWEYWNEQVSGAYAADTAGAWNTGRASHWVATHPTTTKTDGGGGGGQPGNVPVGPGRLLPPSTPPLGIPLGVGIGIGIASVDDGGPLSVAWWRGLLFAKKADLKQLRAAARQAGITDEEDFREFGDWLEQDEKHGEGRGGKDHYSFKELVQLAKEWLELYK